MSNPDIPPAGSRSAEDFWAGREAYYDVKLDALRAEVRDLRAELRDRHSVIKEEIERNRNRADRELRKISDHVDQIAILLAALNQVGPDEWEPGGVMVHRAENV